MKIETKEKNYLSEYLWIVGEVGRLSDHILLNNHKFNTVTPKDLDVTVKRLIVRLTRLSDLYKIQHNETYFNMER